MDFMLRAMLAAGGGGGGGGGARTPHRYWRVRAVTLQSGGSGDFSVGTLQMRTTRGGADQCSGGTALSDSTFDGTTPASNAFDGNDTTYWRSTTGGSNHYIGYDFGTAKNIEQVRIVGRADTAVRNATSLIVESSDDNSTWATEWSHTGLADWSTSEARVLTRPRTTDTNLYWRIWITANYSGSAASMAEIEFRGTVGGSDIASGATFTADSEFGAGFEVSKARDGNGATFWTSNTSGFPHWYKAVFGSAVYVAQVAITARTDVPSLAPASLYIQTCDDNLTWRDSTFLSYPSITAGETKLFNTSYP